MSPGNQVRFLRPHPKGKLTGTGYNIPISLSASTSSSALSGGDFSGGDVYFDFGSGSQAGAPIYQSNSPDNQPVTTASSAASNGGPAVDTSPTSVGAGAPVSSGLGGGAVQVSSTQILLFGVGAIAVVAWLVYRKGL